LVIGYKAGSTVYQLAEQFRINRGTVSKLLEREDVPRRGRPLSPAQIEQATQLYASGLSLVSVGKTLRNLSSILRHKLMKRSEQEARGSGQDR
jgi:hypothetical protein